MTIDTLRRLALFIVLCLSQALVFNRMQLFGYATPLLYVYFVVIMPWRHPRWAVLLWSFFLGLSIDMFSNTPGVAAASLTLIGMIQPPLLSLFVPRDAEQGMRVTLRTIGKTKFLTFSSVLVMLYAALFFALENFSVAGASHLWITILCSALLTLLLMLPLEQLRRK